MPANVATAYVQIIPSAQGIGGGIAQALGGDAAATSAGESIGGKLVNTIKGVIAAAGIGAALGKALTEGAALEQSLGGIETLFGAGGKTIEQYAASVGKSVADVSEKYNSLMRSQETMIANADNAWKNAGVSANDYMEQVTSFSATLLQGLGGDTEAAAKYADQAIVQMADNANKMGTDIASIQYAYQGFAKDNYTMLDNLKLGYGGTQAEMARLINDSGVLGDSIEVTAETVKDVPFDKIIEAIGVIQDDLGITGTTAKEATTTLSGSFASMQAAASNVLANLTLGRDLGPSLNALATTLTTFLTGNLLPAVWNILSALPGALVTFVTSLGPQLVSGIQTMVPQVLTAGTEFIQSLGDGFVQGIPEFLANALPMVLQFTEQLRADFGTLVDAGIEMILKLGQGLVEALPTLIEYVPQIITNIAGLINDNAPKMLAAGLELIVMLGSGFVQGIPEFLANALPMVLQFTEQLRADFGTLVDAGIEMILKLGQGLVEALPTLIEYVPQIITNIAGLINDNAPKMLAAGLELIVMLGSGLIQAIPDLVANLPQIIQAIVSVVTAFNWLGLGKQVLASVGKGITSMAGALKDAVTGGMRSAIDFLKGLPKQALKWGIDMISGLVDGIKSKISDVVGAVADVAGAIASMIHFSRPDIGPLREYEKWMPDMMSGLAKGITSNIYRVTDAMGQLTAFMAEDLQPNAMATGRMRTALTSDAPGASTAPARPGLYGTADTAALLQEVIDLLRLILEAVYGIHIGDDDIGRANARYQASRAIMLGGTV